MGKLRLRISEDSRFKEEIKKLFQNNEKSDLNKYDIAYPSNQRCQVTERSPGVNSSHICKDCYYRDFSEKMEDIRKTKRKEFVEYQMLLRNDQEKWLDEFEELLVDYENQFDRADYSFAREYKEIIEDVRKELRGQETSKNSSGLFDGL